MQTMLRSCAPAALALLLASSAIAQEMKPAAAPAATPAKPDHEKILADSKSIDGVIPLYQKGQSLYAELSSGHYTSEYIVLIAIARGIGQGPLLGGMTWGFGDDWVWQFRKIDDKVMVVRKNVRFRATAGTPEASAVKNAFTDSVMFSLPVMTKGPKGGDLVDLTQIFMSDLPQISQVLPGFQFSTPKSTWESVKGFKDNIELQVAAVYQSAGTANIDTVPDSRNASISVHYSISKLPSTGYQPRLADDRIGYFTTVAMDFSKKTDRDRFVRYVNRWHLEKADASEKLSPPKQPIVFWLEKTIPFKYRKPIREGILEWNKAFEKAGFVNAIEVRQQPDDATWDPEDINYNTFRWITSNAGFAMGPSRVNPYTGQILDADIIFDADFLQFWKDEFENLTPKDVAALTGGSFDLADYRDEGNRSPALHGLGLGGPLDACRLGHGLSHQFALGNLAALAAADPAKLAEMQENLIMQGMKEVTMHEVGHTLGLRHNFIASTAASLSEINDPGKAASGNAVASVMDYNPANIVPKDMKQGDYFPTTLGKYDIWAIEYGYTPQTGGTQGEVKSLQTIAARSGEPGLAFATDEDTRGIDPDPHSNRFDLGNDLVEYAKQRSKLIKELIPGVVERVTKDGDDYVQARKAFNVLMAQYGQAMFFASRYVAGLNTSRSHKGDKDGKPPMSVVEAKKQRDAMALIEENVFSDKPFQVPAELYGFLGASKWSHWGVRTPERPDFPAHDFILMWQSRILDRLTSPLALERLHDTELKVSADKDTFTTAELLERLTKSIFSELDDMKQGDYSTRKPAISSVRRNLQRYYVKRMGQLALGQLVGAPEDCQSVAYAELSSTADKIDLVLKGNVKFDAYSKAHLQETSGRIRKILDAKLAISAP